MDTYQEALGPRAYSAQGFEEGGAGRNLARGWPVYSRKEGAMGLAVTPNTHTRP